MSKGIIIGISITVVAIGTIGIIGYNKGWFTKKGIAPKKTVNGGQTVIVNAPPFIEPTQKDFDNKPNGSFWAFRNGKWQWATN